MTAKLNNSRADLVAANDELALTLLPVILILGAMVVLGVLGNSLVFYIFCFRLRPSTQNYLIVYVTVFDLLSSTVAMPNGIIFLRYIIMFESEVACKIMRFISMFCVIGSIFTLVVIAVDRFRKVCRPLKPQLRIIHIKYSLIPIIGAAIIYAVPLAFIYGLRKVESGVQGISGTDCSPTDVTSFPFVYNVFLFLSFVVLATSLMVIYYRVLRETKRHTRYMKENPISLLTKSHPGHTKDLSNVAKIVDLPSVSLSIEDSTSTSKIMHSLSETPETVTKSMSGPAITMNTEVSVDNNFETKSLRESHSKETLQVPSQGKELMGRGIKDGDTNSEEKNVKKEMPFQLDPDTEIGKEKDITRKQPSWTDEHMKEEDLTDVAVIRSNSYHELTSHLTSVSSGNGGNDVTTASENPDTSENNPGAFCITPKLTLPCEETKDNKKSRAQRSESKTTMIAFLITLVFIVSFLPHLCVLALNRVKKDFDAKLSGAGFVFYHICFRSYILNSVLNPFIYGALNTKFKKEVKRLARKAKMFCKRK